ncbi:MAG: putative SOS response-associated peptidase YedK [Alphaproteobacteria bacterium MarineAlpha9_Bin4]|nr:DUF159 family protein [Pelagibacterales bacterium]PPR24881.1 MAG: putative SOS response-associated peptidase YedK [Alphaproteobacteria bacterium MarineAlpha9_Bin4]|tara:strand:+ start:2452 stop:3024 length:573 start_codon:yes stop_codon:yes gene_type:complete
MCGRYALFSKNKIKKKFNIFIKPNYNLCPSNTVLVLDKEATPKFMKWHFKPLWGKSSFNIINARIETLSSKAVFKNSLRCIFIADGYFEWKRIKNIKKPFYHYYKSDLMFFAGIYNSNLECCIVTKESNKEISHIHNRQPLLLKKLSLKNWLKSNYDSSDISNDLIYYHEVDVKVNNPHNNDISNILEIK